MIALVTGASSGLGYDMSIELAKRGYDLIVVARRVDKLNELKDRLEQEYKIKVIVESMDVTNKDNIYTLINKYPDIDVLINNAGFGLCGDYLNIDLEKEESMIDLNITTLHILTKEYAKRMQAKDYGYILNVGSVASFAAGPKMAAYYASKAYVLNLSEAIHYELKSAGSKVRVCTLCPGPTKTEFETVAGANFGITTATSKYIAKVGIDKLLKGKRVIIPGVLNKLMVFGMKYASRSISLRIINLMQSKRI